MSTGGSSAPKPLTKTQIIQALAERSGLSKKQVSDLFEQLSGLIGESLQSSGVFAVPGLMKIKRVQKDATPAKFGVPNPFRPGETMDVAAKPAKIIVKVQPLKALKEMV